MTEESIEMRFTKEGIEVRKKVDILGESEWHSKELDYEELSGKNIVNIESVEPTIEGGELKSFTFRGEKIQIKESDKDQTKESPQKKRIGGMDKGIVIREEEFSCNTARDLLIKSSNWLIEKGYLTKHDLPVDYGGSKRWLINDKNEHKDKDDFFYPKRLDNGWYIETNYSKETCKRHTKWLLSEFGLEENEFEIKGF